jgi:hypothetical protein
MDQYVTLPQVTQQFQQVRDTVGNLIGPITACGARQYQFDYTPTFLQVNLTSDIFEQISLGVESMFDSDIGNYPISIRVSLVSFPNVMELITGFTIYIHPRPVNRLPFFSPKLPLTEIIQLLVPERMPTSWSFEIPSIIDPDGETVTMTYALGLASSFVSFQNGQLIIDDIRDFNSTSMAPGFYPIFFTLNDGNNSTIYTLPLILISAYDTSNSTNSTSLETDLANQQAEEQHRLELQAYINWLQ